MTVQSSWFAVLVSLGIWTGCGGDDPVGNGGDLVGGSCISQDDCAEICATGDDFPRGTCATTCLSDDDCPSGTHCIDHDGDAICLLRCDLPADCRDGYTCKGESNAGHDGDSLVCIAD